MRGSPVPLSLFATARRHWAWLRDAIERHCQFSGRPVYTGLKKNEGSCTPSLGYTQPTGKSHTQVDACVCGGERQGGMLEAFLPLPPRVPAICSPSCILLA
jgi:hypothetical protein